ncbi:MAG: AraC family transcriptional regulator [Succinivibrio sp.]
MLYVFYAPKALDQYMEWFGAIRKTITLLENNLLEDLDFGLIAKEVGISPVYLQKGFTLITGMTTGEYIRNRRLYLAALDLIATSASVTDLAFKYGYETTESFSRAFSRFHGDTPLNFKKQRKEPKVFLPLTVNIEVKGGLKLDCTIETADETSFIGFRKQVPYENSGTVITKLWDEFYDSYKKCYTKAVPANPVEEVIKNCCVGEFGLCLDADPYNDTRNSFTYMLAGKYRGGAIPDGMQVVTIKKSIFAVFECEGPLPGSLTAVNSRIFKEWLPDNELYELDGNISIEWFSYGDPKSSDYLSKIYLPVKKRDIGS